MNAPDGYKVEKKKEIKEEDTKKKSYRYPIIPLGFPSFKVVTNLEKKSVLIHRSIQSSKEEIVKTDYKIEGYGGKKEKRKDR